LKQKPHIALLPGLDGTGELFEPIIPYLEHKFEISIIAYSSQHSFLKLVEYARSQLPSNNNISLVAESFSGPVAISMLAQDNVSFGPSVLCATFTKSPYKLLADLAKHLPESVYDLDSINQIALDLFGINKTTTKDVRNQVLDALKKTGPKTLKARIKILSELDVSDEIANIQVPLLFIQAEQDKIVSKSTVHKQMLGFDNIRFASVKGPHLLMQANPQECANLIIEHVTSYKRMQPDLQTATRFASR